MIDRGKVAPVLLVLGAGLAAVGSFTDTYRTYYPGYSGPGQVMTTSLWIIREEPPTATPPLKVYSAAGWPVILAAALVVVAAVLVVRGRAATIGRPLATGAAGALAGIVLTYVLQVLRDKELMDSWPGGQNPQLDLLGGTYLLVAAAVIGLVGAVLVQREQQALPQEEEDEQAVVVHQLGSDDDTPPFGIAVLGEEQQETR